MSFLLSILSVIGMIGGVWWLARMKRKYEGTNTPLGKWLQWWQKEKHFKIVMEWAVLGIGAWFVAGVFLSFNPHLIPDGREFLSTIQYYHFWEWVSECGTCAFWAPFNGGFPLLGDPSQGVLYPLIAIPVMLFGVINGVKVAIFLAFFSVGMATWWMGALWHLPRWLCQWGAWMVMASGMIAGRLELGDMHTVLSLSALTWWFPSWWYLWHSKSRFAFLPFAWAVGMSLLAARGYHLFGMLFAWPGVVLVSWWLDRDQGKRLLRRAGAALFGGSLLAAPVILPLIHMLPATYKEVDPAFRASQPFGDLLLNFLVANPDFYRSDILGKLPYPHLTFFFIGWIPFLLACYGFAAVFLDNRLWYRRKLVVVWLAWSVLILWESTGQPLRWLVTLVPHTPLANFLAGFRHIEQVAALAVPAIIGLSMIGVEALITQSREWRLDISIGMHSITIPMVVFLALPLVWALRQGWYASGTWLNLVDYPKLPALQFLEEEPEQWVAPPFGVHFWMEPVIAQHLKVLSIQRWRWKAWELPPPRRFLVRSTEPPDVPEGAHMVTLEEGLYGIIEPQAMYAFVAYSDDRQTPCEAEGWGGILEVRCEVLQDGVLWVMEHPWPGWWAKVNGQWQSIESTLPYLHLPVREGEQIIQLRFVPKYELVGGILALAWLLWQMVVVFQHWRGHQVVRSTVGEGLRVDPS